MIHILLDSIRQLVAPRHILHNDILVLDTRFPQLLPCALEQRVNNLGVPSCVDDANAQSRACSCRVSMEFLRAGEGCSGGGGGVGIGMRELRTIVCLWRAGTFEGCHSKIPYISEYM